MANKSTPKKTLPTLRWLGVDLNDPQIQQRFRKLQIEHLGRATLRPDSSGLLMRPGWQVQSYEETETIVYAAATYQPPATPVCPHCGTMGDVIGFGTRQQTIVDLPARGKGLHIQVKRQRYRCQSCDGTFMQPLPDVDVDHRMTRDLVIWLREEAMERTFTSIAEDLGIGEATIRRVFGEYVAELDAARTPYSPEWLGIDEVKLVGDYRAIFTDIQNRRPIELLHHRTKQSVMNFLSTLDRDKVRLVAMDMWPTYRDAVYALFPKARIVVDKFHIQRMANDAMEKVRKRTRREIEKDRQKRQLKRDRVILLRRNFELTDQERLILSTWIGNFEDLGLAYQYKEAYLDIWNSSTRLSAESRYREWVDDLPASVADDFSALTTAMKNWHKEIFAYFDVGITNAYTEAVNGVIKQVNRQGRGYSFPAIRAKLLYHPRRRAPSEGGLTLPEQGSLVIDYRDVAPEYRPTYTMPDGSECPIGTVILAAKRQRQILPLGHPPLSGLP